MAGNAHAQYPPPVDLDVRNIAQATPVWCWAAAAQQIISRIKGDARTPRQCRLVAFTYGLDGDVCCRWPKRCLRGGTLRDIQTLIRVYGGRTSSLHRPTDPESLYDIVSAGHLVVMQWRPRQTSRRGHVVVVRGMTWEPTPEGLEPFVIVNDPRIDFSRSIPFRDLENYWGGAIIVD